MWSHWSGNVDCVRRGRDGEAYGIAQETKNWTSVESVNPSGSVFQTLKSRDLKQFMNSYKESSIAQGGQEL